jgi:hypothetical protein
MGAAMIDIAWEWDGITPTAILWIENKKLTGEPGHVRAAFEQLCALRDHNSTRDHMLDQLLAKARDVEKEAERLAASARRQGAL